MTDTSIERVVAKTGLPAAAVRRKLEEMSPQGRLYTWGDNAHGQLGRREDEGGRAPGAGATRAASARRARRSKRSLEPVN